jgi:hypothetical protein
LFSRNTDTNHNTASKLKIPPIRIEEKLGNEIKCQSDENNPRKKNSNALKRSRGSKAMYKILNEFRNDIQPSFPKTCIRWINNRNSKGA